MNIRVPQIIDPKKKRRNQMRANQYGGVDHVRQAIDGPGYQQSASLPAALFTSLQRDFGNPVSKWGGSGENYDPNYVQEALASAASRGRTPGNVESVMESQRPAYAMGDHPSERGLIPQRTMDETMENAERRRSYDQSDARWIMQDGGRGNRLIAAANAQQQKAPTQQSPVTPGIPVMTGRETDETAIIDPATADPGTYRVDDSRARTNVNQGNKGTLTVSIDENGRAQLQPRPDWNRPADQDERVAAARERVADRRERLKAAKAENARSAPNRVGNAIASTQQASGPPIAPVRSPVLENSWSIGDGPIGPYDEESSTALRIMDDPNMSGASFLQLATSPIEDGGLGWDRPKFRSLAKQLLDDQYSGKWLAPSFSGSRQTDESVQSMLDNSLAILEEAIGTDEFDKIRDEVKRKYQRKPEKASQSMIDRDRNRTEVDKLLEGSSSFGGI